MQISQDSSAGIKAPSTLTKISHHYEELELGFGICFTVTTTSSCRARCALRLPVYGTVKPLVPGRQHKLLQPGLIVLQAKALGNKSKLSRDLSSITASFFYNREVLLVLGNEDANPLELRRKGILRSAKTFNSSSENH